jgi:hypothetical protein
MANQATTLARSVAQFQVREDAIAPHEPLAAAKPAASAPLARAPEPQRRVASASHAPAAPREPALAAAELDEWKEF